MSKWIWMVGFVLGASGCGTSFSQYCETDDDCSGDLRCIDTASDLFGGNCQTSRICSRNCSSDSDCTDVNGVCKSCGNTPAACKDGPGD